MANNTAIATAISNAPDTPPTITASGAGCSSRTRRFSTKRT